MTKLKFMLVCEVNRIITCLINSTRALKGQTGENSYMKEDLDCDEFMPANIKSFRVSLTSEDQTTN